MSRFKFFDGENNSINPNVSAGAVAIQPEQNPVKKEEPLITYERYRVEQLTLTKLDGIVQSHAETKREFAVTRKETSTGLIVDVIMEDNIVKVYPDALQDTINLLIELDIVKSTASILVNPVTGDVDKVINHDEIIQNWKTYRKQLEHKFESFQSSEAKLNILKFLTVAENTIVIEQNLISDLKTKMFYDLFFKPYLVNDKLDLNDFTNPFYSQLFEGESTLLNFSQNITNENENQIQYTKIGSLKEPDKVNFEPLYNAKYKPLVQYKYSAYDAKITETILLNKTNKWIEQADVTIVEEVKNNVELLVDYKLRKIE